MKSDKTEPPEQSMDFAGWGSAARLQGLATPRREPEHRTRLGQLASTAICGNDITSSCLYVSALCAAAAGVYAPIALAIVALVLFLFRRVYAEVGSALPLNGGTYTVLLNTTNKRLAAAAACLTLLSYVATAVISAGEAMHYAHNLIPGLPVIWATVGLLGFFALLSLIGIGESAVVAVGIFLFHMVTLVVLCVGGAWFALQHPEQLSLNWGTPHPDGLLHALFFGFAAAMLGISGFESSANFIEEQKEGVFPKTLRNMWLAVAVFNPLLSLLSLAVLPLAEIQQVPPDLLAEMGERSVGQWLGIWVSADAVLVLSGAVLTSFVGVTGLMRRMTIDRCLPQALLATNRSRGTNHWIILSFLAVCCSILWVTGGEVTLLAGVYTLSFLSVMALFAIGNMLLKVKRARLPRATRASWLTVSIALGAVVLGLVGNVLANPAYVRVFGGYFAVSAGLVALMFLRVQLLRVGLFVARALIERLSQINQWVSERVLRTIDAINSQRVVYFAKGDDPAELNRAALYVLENELTTQLTVVHVYADEAEIPPELARHLFEIDHLYPELRIDFLAVEGAFGPELTAALSEKLGVPLNYMFIGTPGDRFPHRIEAMGGVRLIL